MKLDTVKPLQVPFWPVVAGVSLAIASIGVVSVQGQNNPPNPTPSKSNNQSPRSREASSQGQTVWAEEAFKYPSIGLSMRMPEGTVSQGTFIGTNETYQIKPKEDPPIWVISAKVHQTKGTEITVSQAADSVIRALEEAAGQFDQSELITNKDATRKLIGTAAKVIHRETNLRLGGKEAQQFFVSLPESNQENVRVVRGVTLVHLAPGQFLSMELRVAESNLPVCRQTYLDMMRTMTFADIAALSAARGISIKAGDAFLAGLTEQDFRAICSGKPLFLRLFRPAGTGDEMDAVELGYHQLTIREGVRGEVDPSVKRSNYLATDHDRGYLVTIKSRVLDEQPGTPPSTWARIDSEGYFFVAQDRQSEAWTLSMTQHDGSQKKPPVWTETGARENKSMSVTLMAPGEPTQTRQLRVPTEAYLNLAEVYMLPALLVRHGAAIEFGFYAYRSKNEAIVMRTDSLSRPGDKPNLWKIASRAGENETPMSTLYNADGTMIRRELGDATVWEPIDPKRLLDLWQKKGYPTK
jgi:hypothetical protein